MNRSPVEIARITLPAFGRSTVCPSLPAELYQARLQQTAERLRAAKLHALVIYADREHCANVSYLTGFDPRFEEALLLLSAEGQAKLLVGNECLGYLPDLEALGLEVELFQEFSLLGQPRTDSRSLRAILAEFGIEKRRAIGCAGWKYFEGGLVQGGSHALDVPAYLADLLRDLTGDPKLVSNATRIFMDVQDGLRAVNETAQIAQFEHAAGITSSGVLRLLQHLEPGVAEQDLEKHLDARGLPLSCHRMISFGDKAKHGLASPGAGRARLGGAYTTAFGVQGALTCRAGVVARQARDLPELIRAFYPRFAANYFQAIAAWFETVRVGASASAVVRAVERVRDKALFRLALNPGHYLHLDEWLHSPFSAGSSVRLRSGMVLQMDIIPVSLGPFCCGNAEDGVVLANAVLRAQLAKEFPVMWERMVARRAFMRNTLGIRVDGSVLPLGNTSGWFAPYALDLKTAFRVNL